MNKAASQVAKLPGELRKLADAACNGTLTDGQRARLEKLLARNKTSQLAYLSYLDVHAQLQWEGRCGAAPEQDAVPADKEPRATDRCDIEDQVALLAAADRRLKLRRRKWTAATVTAAVVAPSLRAVSSRIRCRSPPRLRHSNRRACSASEM